MAIKRIYNRLGYLGTRFFRGLAEDLGQKFTLHDLRATTASLLAADNVPEAAIRAYLGHRQAAGVTGRYVSLSPDEVAVHILPWNPLVAPMPR